MSLIPKWVVKKEKIGGEWYWMIYRRWLWIDSFYERCNTEESCLTRLHELRHPQSIEIAEF